MSVEQLVQGCILKEPVYSLSKNPIISKNTVINQKHIEVLKAFFINKVEVSETLNNGELFNPISISAEQKKELQGKSFEKNFHIAVDEYKKVFHYILGKGQVDLLKLSNMLYPLLEQAFENQETVFKLNRISNKEDYLYSYPIATALIAGVLAVKDQQSYVDCFKISLAGLFSNIGLAKLDTNLINKKSLLTSDETNKFNKHVIESYNLISSANIDEDIKIAVVQHEEYLDGTGYPIGLEDGRIHLYSKYIAVAEYFCKNTFENYFFESKAAFDVMDEMITSCFRKFELSIVKSLIHQVSMGYIGSIVKLSDQSVGEIIFVDPLHPTKPIVKTSNDKIKQLFLNKNLSIKEIL